MTLITSGRDMRNIINKNSMITVVGVVVTLLCYEFLWGKLFPFSPVVFGFEKHELTNTVVYTQHGAAFDDFERIDSLLSAVEEFHQLVFTKKPRVFIFRDRTSYERRSVSRARFCAFPKSSLVISPWAVEEAERGEISLEIYLTHELSHILLYQHMGLLRAYSYPKWLMEGIAVYSADQLGTSWYPGKQETYELIGSGNFMPPENFKTRREDSVALDVPYRITFTYSEFACLVDYLVQTGGKETFLAYIKALLRTSDHERVFLAHYGVGFEQMVSNFREHVHENMDGPE